MLASFPDQAPELEVRRIAFARPRAEGTALIGATNQSLPVLMPADDAPGDLPAATHAGRRYVNVPMAILGLRPRRDGFARAHPGWEWA